MRYRPWRIALSSFLVLAAAPAACAQVTQPESPPTARPWMAVGTRGMVASDSAYASEAGAHVLRAGGNAVDAAVATSFALAVTRPYSMGLGGGGFMMVRLHTGEVFVLDYREVAPAAATPDMFVKARTALPDGPAPSQYGGLAVGVPGHVAGHATMHARLGNRPWHELLAPAIALAEEGFAVDSHYAAVVREALKEIAETPELKPISSGLRQRLLFDGQAPSPGALLRQPELAQTLRRVAEGGAAGFYRGPVAAALAGAAASAGGILTEADLAAYRPVWRQPLRMTYREPYEILLMPPPSSGGICIAETLNMLERWDLAAVQARDPALAAHLTVEAMKRAFADRACHLGDADFVPVPTVRLTSKGYARELGGTIREDSAIAVAACGTQPHRDAGTSHFCVADRWGNVVSATETINTSFGSLVVAEPVGVVLNNEMDDFTAEPGQPNAFGLQQSAQNAIAPGKRPLSSMSPTIVLRDGKPILALGASGGPRIISATLQVMIDVMDYGQPVEQAIEQPRYHHQWKPDVVYRNQYPPDSPVVVGLRQRGHRISDEQEDAVVQALQITRERLVGVSDPRKGGRPAGF